MSYRSKSGKEFSNLHMARRDDVMHETPKTKLKINPLGDKSDGTEILGKVAGKDQEQPETQDSGTVVAEHGPATEVVIKHEGDKHTVTSKHADGHVHKSVHETAEDAHVEGKQLAGASEDVAPEDEESDGMPQMPAGLMGA